MFIQNLFIGRITYTFLFCTSFKHQMPQFIFFSNSDFQINLFRNIIEWIRGNGVGGNPSDFETTEP